ncbi:MAG: response regulator transcription factor [Prolixibacteraceae bacterium]|nr:response regulator transcription factor [Prolixibacteraceae bacterium]
MSKQKIKLILVDDHQIFIDGIESMFMIDDCIEIVETANNAAQLATKLKYVTPDIIVLDLSLPGKSGFEIMEEIRANLPDMKFMILSANNDEESIIRSLKSGARGFLNKDTTKEEFKKAILAINSGDEYFSESVSRIIFKRYSESIINNNKQSEADQLLTSRERDIIVLLCDGLAYKEIADRLCISARTVETHRKNILEKLDIHSNAELVKYAIKEGLISLD